MYAEYAIWGIPPKQNDETLLIAMPNGKPVTSRDHAERLVVMLEDHGCTACRIQVLDGSIPNFAATVSI